MISTHCAGWITTFPSVSRDVPEMGKQAMRLLLQRLKAERGERAGARECLPTELLLRGSELLPESGRAH